MADIYGDGTYLENNPTWHEEDAGWKALQIRRMLEKHTIRAQRVAEIGCGTGEVLNQLARQYPDGRQFVGYEISPQAFALCAAKTNAKLTFVLADLLADDKAFFDLLLVIDVFEHVEDYFGFLRRLRTKADYKLFHIPLGLSVQTVLRATPLAQARRSVGHIHAFTKEMALDTLTDTGYELIDYVYTGRAVDLPDKGWKTALLKAPRRLAFAVNRDLTVRVLGGYSLLVLAR